jgi:hypothetical protein
MGLTVYFISMDLRMKRTAKLPDVPRKLQRLFPRIDPGHAESAPRQPRLHRRDILIRRSKLLAELIRRQPLVKVRITRRMQLADQLLERRFLARAALQHQVDPVQLRAVGQGSAVVLRVGQRMHCALERYQLALVYRSDDA